VSHLSPVPSDPDELEAWLATVMGGSADRSFAERSNPEVSLPAPLTSPAVLTVKVALTDTEPPVWRRLRLPGDLKLDAVHDVLQEAMGWTDSHLHRFFAGPSFEDPYFVTEDDLEEGEEGTPEHQARLDQVLREPGDRIRYEYDFGDGWEHDVRLEELAPLVEDDRPRCLAGRRACPPEDVGGVPGFQALLAWHDAGRIAEALPDGFTSLEHALDWIPPDWDPAAFDADDVDLRLQAQHAAGDVLRRVRPEAFESFGRLGVGQEQIATWLDKAGRVPALTDSDLDDLTGPWRTLLAVIGGGVQLSKAGWLPAEQVAELCTALDINPVLAGKANRESNVRSLAGFRKVATQVGLLHKSKGVLAPTLKGIELGDDPAGLWAHIAQRMPVGRGEIAKDAGWFTLAALAGGVDQREVYDEVHRLLVDAGWQAGGQDIDRWSTPPLVWPTLDCLLGTRRMEIKRSPSWLQAAAAAALLTS